MDDMTFVPALAYRDPKAALDWLARAFDFELTMAIDGPDDDPTQCHYEMGYDGRGPHHDRRRVERVDAQPGVGRRAPTPRSTHVEVARDIDAHCERARAAGADLLAEPSRPVLRRPRRTAAPIPRATTGRSPCTCAT